MAKDKTEIGKNTGDLVPAKKRTPANKYEYEKERRENLKKRPGDPAGDSRLIQALRRQAQSTGNYAEAKTFREFIEIAEAITDADRRLARTGLVSKRADDLQKEIDAVTSGKKPKTQTVTTRSGRAIKRSELSSIVKEEDSIDEKFSAVDSSKPQSPKPTVLPRSREANIGPHDDWKDNPSTEWNDRSPKAKKLKSRASAVVGTQRRQDQETGVREETEIDEAKVDAGLSDKEKAKVRTARQGYAGAEVRLGPVSVHTGNVARREAHRNRDDKNKTRKQNR